MADCFILKNNAKEKERQYAYGLTKEYSDFGNTEWVEILARDIDNFFMSENATIEICFRVSSINSGTGDNLGRVFEIADTGNKVFLSISLDDNLSKINFKINTWSNPAFSYRTEINKLYTITLKQTTSTTAIYINGEFFTSINKYIATGKAFYKIRLKASIDTSNRLMQGRVYSLRLYNRALSEAEILYNYKIDNYGGENMSKQNIKSMEFDTITSSGGIFETTLSIDKTKIIQILCSIPEYTVGFVFQINGESNWCAAFYPTGSLSSALKNTHVQGVILYIDEL